MLFIITLVVSTSRDSTSGNSIYQQAQPMLLRGTLSIMASQVSSTESQVARAVRDVLQRIETATQRASRNSKQVCKRGRLVDVAPQRCVLAGAPGGRQQNQTAGDGTRSVRCWTTRLWRKLCAGAGGQGACAANRHPVALYWPPAIQQSQNACGRRAQPVHG